MAIKTWDDNDPSEDIYETLRSFTHHFDLPDPIKNPPQNTCEDGACIDCGRIDTLVFDKNRGESICSVCGCVNECRQIDERKEWRAYNVDEESKKSRCGSPLNRRIYDGGLSTKIGAGNRDWSGAAISPIMSQKLNSLRKVDDHTKQNHSMYNNYNLAMADLDRLSIPTMLDLNKNIQDQVASMYKKILDSRFFKNYNSHFILLALIYRVCQEHHDIRTIYEISTKGKIKTHKFTQYLVRVLDFFNYVPIRIPPEDYLIRIVKILKIDNTDIFLLAKKICQFVKNIADKDVQFITGKEPAGIAGASLYFACKVWGYPCTQHNIARAINITEVTVRCRLNDILTVFDCPPEEYWGKLDEWMQFSKEKQLAILKEYSIKTSKRSKKNKCKN